MDEKMDEKKEGISIEPKDIPDSLLTEQNRRSRIITNFFDEKFRDVGCAINATQYDLIRLLWTTDAGSITALGKAIGMDRSTLTRRLHPLVKYGYVDLENGDGKKKKIPIPTKKGINLLKKFYNVYMNTDKEARATGMDKLI